MKTLKFDNREEWLEARRGKITGSRLKDVVTKRGTGWKVGVYELIAERLGIPADDENAMDRGTRLEPEAMEAFIIETGKKVDTSLVMWVSDKDESIAISPDGFIGKTEAVEIKCLGSARHIEAFCTQKIPDDYFPQVVQYFICNEKLKTLYFAMYDPRVLAKPFFYFTVKREEVQEEIEEYLAHEDKVLLYVREVVNSLTF
jgi:putative phage-type endonuclease